MPPTLFKKECPRCAKSFLTYDNVLVYCNSDCEKKHAYELKFPRKKELKKTQHCLYCGLEQKNQYCSVLCKKNHNKQKVLDKHKETWEKAPKRRGRPIPYELLNKLAEKRRVMEEDHAFNMVRYGGKRNAY